MTGGRGPSADMSNMAAFARLPADSSAAFPSGGPKFVNGVYFFPTDPFADDASNWDGMVPLPQAQIRIRSRFAYKVSRSLWWGRGRRHFAAAGLMASCALLAACASAARSVSETPNSSVAAVQTPIRLSASLPGLRSGRPYGQRAVETARLEPAQEADGRSDEVRLAPQPGTVESDAAAGEPAEASVGAVPAQTGFSFLNRDAAPDRAVTELVAFHSAPFPYNGAQPGGSPFFNVNQDGQRGHRGRRGQVLWEGRTFSDNRVLVHVPAHFDPDRPAVMVLFLHGYGATLSRDVAARQQVPQQISASGANAVLVAPQFAKDARDPSIGHFWEQGGFRTFLREAAQQLARASGNPAAVERFAHMPIVLVAYSGGYYPGSFCLKDIAGSHRVRGILMLDAAYGEFERYADWAAENRSSFLVSSYTPFTARQNAGLKALLAARGVPLHSSVTESVTRGGATFLAADYPHNDYVTQAWTEDPIRDILARMPELRLRDPQAIASMDTAPTASIH